MNGFYKFSVKFADGNENEAYGFVYASTYISAMEKVEDLVSDEDIISIKLEGMEPGDTLLMPEWIANKVFTYDYYAADYKMDDESTYSITDQGKEVLKNMSIRDENKPLYKDKIGVTVQKALEAMERGEAVHLPSYPAKEND